MAEYGSMAGVPIRRATSKSRIRVVFFGFRVSGFAWVSGFGFRVSADPQEAKSSESVWGFGFRVS